MVTMKIGLFGGMANNIYRMAKSLYKSGYYILFIRDIFDKFAISQPIWEDISLTMSEKDLEASKNWDIEKWYNIEKTYKWEEPPWMIDPNKDINYVSKRGWIANYPSFTSNLIYNLLESKYPIIQKIREYFKNCDFVIVCGVMGEIIAKACGKPYGIWPHGSDIRLAAGLENKENKNICSLNYLKNLLISKLLKEAFQKATWVGSHCPSGVGGFLGDTIKELKLKNYRRIPLPIEPSPPLNKSEKREILKDILKKLKIEIPNSETIFFMPTRLDIYWKGNDIFFKAFSNIKNKLPYGWAHIICCSWGKDKKVLEELCKRLKIEENVTILPFVLSKPLLYQLLKASDIVIDQFKMGRSYGSLTIESMAHGVPVLAYIDESYFKMKGYPSPPVLNAFNEKILERILLDLAHNKIDILSLGYKGINWINKYHSISEFIRSIGFKN